MVVCFYRVIKYNLVLKTLIIFKIKYVGITSQKGFLLVVVNALARKKLKQTTPF